MTLIDAGPLIALVDARDKKNHQGCLTAFQSLKSAPLTTWPCVAEASYLLGQINGWPAQQMLLGLLKSGSVIIHETVETELGRIYQLLEQYRNVPMDLADACLVSLAELHGVRRILTLDDDFFIDRINGKDSFDVIKP
jgi:hypothetical protein